MVAFEGAPVSTPCHFCGEDRPLRLSHIIPKFLVKNIKGPKGNMMGINGRGPHGAAALQDGLKQHLFCSGCEQFFSATYERPYEQFWRKNSPLPDPWTGPECRVTFDYVPFKLFHLLNLYRAGVSTLQSYAHVELGPHLLQMRDMLRRVDPGGPSRYQIAGSAIVESSGRLARVVSIPQKRRYGTKVAWETSYNGVNWMVAVSGDFPSAIRASALHADGSMKFTAYPWHAYTFIHDAAEMLRSPPR